jgi:hypothetical protein
MVPRMIADTAAAASWFLWVVSALVLVVFALPLTFTPFAWARVFRWQVNPGDDLALYFGRCLGVVALTLVVGGFRAAPAPADFPIVLELYAVASFLLAGVHIAGAVTHRQPWPEHVEIGMYLLLGVVAAVLRAGL